VGFICVAFRYGSKGGFGGGRLCWRGELFPAGD